jgi:GNAT superfamily N-acetyltransferase
MEPRPLGIKTVRWRRFRGEDEEAVSRFLAEGEDRHVAAVSRFLERRNGDRSWIASEEEIRAFSFLGAGGAFFPVFGSGESASRRKRSIGAVARCLALHRVRFVQAIAEDSSIAETALAKLGYAEPERIEYELMGMEGKPSAASLGCGPSGLVVSWASRADVDRLFPLQAAYEREEVVPLGAELHLASCRLALERTLDSRRVLMAELDGKLVAKANTNARSYGRDQIGGVYVLQEYRGRGIGTRIVAELVEAIAADKRAATLFVKKRNRAAIAAYSRIGFDARDDYRISYY